MDKNLEVLKKLYLVPNPFQFWVIALTLLAILFLFKGSRRLAGIWFLVTLACMGIFFSLQKMMKDFAPKDVSVEPPPKTTSRHHH